jgi:hypothetical protein
VSFLADLRAKIPCYRRLIRASVRHTTRIVNVACVRRDHAPLKHIRVFCFIGARMVSTKLYGKWESIPWTGMTCDSQRESSKNQNDDEIRRKEWPASKREAL